MNIDSIKIYPDVHRTRAKQRQESGNALVYESKSAGLCEETKLNRGYLSDSLTRDKNIGAVTFGSAAAVAEKATKAAKDTLFDKILKLCDKHTVIAQNLVALVLAVGFRPAAIMALPGKKDEDIDDKIYASCHGIASGVIGFAFSSIIMYPLGQAAAKAKKIIRQAQAGNAKDLPKETIESMKKAFKVNDLKDLEHSKGFKNVTKILDMAPDVFIFGVLKAMLTIKLIKPIMKYVFGMEKKDKKPENDTKATQHKFLAAAMPKPDITKFAGGLK